ncbi:hypothetical protein SIN8267_01211 [Sinobacterium norvegicum]|uniref:DUF58 domain-containing protein n=2 Tax=Sinobacterium norvegicum TaxID=1641715 RepID=A0ABN8EIV9_9GAMM|nr:hypothetical protein SIN8267_01211 [Sinobacterium norvegicum]
MLAGKHKSSQRGRGMDFVELRHYHPGDDVRCIDWRVSQRTGQMYLREFALETDKTLTLIIDQRSSLFFASDGSIKAVLAAEIAAVVAGRARFDGDRIAGQVITDTGLQPLIGGRGQQGLLLLIEQLIDANQRLPNTEGESYPHGMIEALSKLCGEKVRDRLVVIVSDFIDVDAEKLALLLAQLSRHNSVMGCCVYDPLEQQLPTQSLLLADNRYQLSLSRLQDGLRKRFHRAVADEGQRLASAFSDNGLALLMLSTHQDCWQQLQQQINAGA